jgi:hypothetical protein
MMLGQGAFKTAHPGFLSLHVLTQSGLGRHLNEPVAVKRYYIKIAKKRGSNRAASSADASDDHDFKIGRLGPADERVKITMEGNVLYWATALMAFSYAFIDRALAKAAVPPPFTIPRVRYVHAGVAVVHASPSTVVESANAANGTMRAVYLLEERIYEGDGENEFLKYIHNTDAVSQLSIIHPRWELSQFFCFLQHVQYFKTEAAAYISDFQGEHTLPSTQPMPFF